MRTKLSNFEVIVMCFLSLIPWPGPSVFKISCSRESACVVRKIIQSKWIPILDKYQVKIPLECPFHPLRDIFGPQQLAKKQNRPSQWTCGFCGKSFYEEKYLDMHFENRHKNNINMAEDAICLADYCDIMRCEVLVSKDSTLSFGDSNTMSTDIEIWNEATAYRTALAQSGPRDLAKLPNTRTKFLPLLSRFQQQQQSSSSSSPSSASSTHKNDNEYVKKLKPKNNCDKLDKKNAKKKNVISKYNSKKTSSTIKIINDDGDDDDDEDVNGNNFENNVNSPRKNNKNNDNINNDYDNNRMGNGEDDDDDDGDDDGDDDDDDEDDEDDDDEQDINSTTPCSANLVDSSLPPIDKKNKKTLSKLQKKIKTNCNEEELENLKKRCEILIRDCIIGLLIHLSEEDFKKMEDELNRSVCWYLTCERYWEDGPIEQKAFPWGLVLVLVMILSLGVCFCYYIIWILFDSDDNANNIDHQLHHHLTPSHYHYQQQQFGNISHMVTDQKGNTSLSNFPMDQQPPQQQQQQQQHQQQQQQQQYPIGFTEDVYAAPDFNEVAQNEHYIYVTYPPELKRRLFESCYNRTTRL